MVLSQIFNYDPSKVQKGEISYTSLIPKKLKVLLHRLSDDNRPILLLIDNKLKQC